LTLPRRGDSHFSSLKWAFFIALENSSFVRIAPKKGVMGDPKRE